MAPDAAGRRVLLQLDRGRAQRTCSRLDVEDPRSRHTKGQNAERPNRTKQTGPFFLGRQGSTALERVGLSKPCHSGQAQAGASRTGGGKRGTRYGHAVFRSRFGDRLGSDECWLGPTDVGWRSDWRPLGSNRLQARTILTRRATRKQRQKSAARLGTTLSPGDRPRGSAPAPARSTPSVP